MERKTNHYWEIHKRVFNRHWNRADRKIQQIIANGATWCPEYGEFMQRVDKKVKELYNDPEFHFNERTTFVEQFKILG